MMLSHSEELITSYIGPLAILYNLSVDSTEKMYGPATLFKFKLN